MRDAVDFDLHGFVGIRVIPHRSGDADVVGRQLGLSPQPLERDPDIVVEFVDRIDVDRTMTYVGWPTGVFGADDYYVERRSGTTTTLARVPFADVGGCCCTFVCESGGSDVPLLLAAVNLIALGKGVLPLHASAFEYKGRGVLVTGWSKGGKTELLLVFAQHGARYVGDEWVYLDPDGQMYGVPEPIRLWRWQLRQLPDIWRRVPVAQRVRLRLLEQAARACHSRPLARLSPVMRGTPILERQLWVRTPPSQLFKNQAPAPQQARLDDVILTLSTTDGDVTTGTADGTEVAQRMAASLAQEREPFDSYYRQFLFAFPDRRNPVVDSAGMRESALLRERLGGRTVTVLRHRYPVDLGTLFEPVRQQLRLG